MPSTRREVLASAGALVGASMVPLPTQLLGASPAPPETGPATRPHVDAVCLADFEAAARRCVPPMSCAYVDGGAGDEITLRWNREAFDRVHLCPRVLVDVSSIDTRLTLLGQELAYPILLAPTACHRLVHPEGELATARGAGAVGATFVVSTSASVTIEDIGQAATAPLWFQLYVQKDRGFTRELVRRAEDAGCRALVLTVDTPVNGVRNRQERANFALPPGVELANLRGLNIPASQPQPRIGEVFAAILPSRLTWDDVAWLRSFARVPVLLKGILNPDDADRAVREGAGGIIVSNHGGRNLDTVPATIDALPVVAEQVAGRVPVLMDGGVRRGTDVLKALALGAQAVLIGRPYLYALGAAGAGGVSRVVNILRSELETAMALTGRPTLSAIDRSVIWPRSRP